MPNFHSVGAAPKRTRPERFTGRTFERIAIPAAELSRGPVRVFEKSQQHRFRVGRCPHDLIGQQELTELPIEIGARGRWRRLGEIFRDGVGIGVESGKSVPPPPGQKPAEETSWL